MIISQNNKNNSGITIISLVVTIVVLLILAGISLNAAINDNGVIHEAKDASNLYTNASSDEQESLSNIRNTMQNTSSGTTSGDSDIGDDSGNKQTFEIKFDANGGTGSMEALNAEQASTIVIPTNSFTRTRLHI